MATREFKPASSRTVRRRPKATLQTEDAPVEAATAASPPPVAPVPAPVEAFQPREPGFDGEALLAELDGISEADMAALMAGGSPGLPEPGDKVLGSVIRVSRDTVFIDLGGKAEGLIDLNELDHLPAVGEKLEARVQEADERGVRLTMKLTGHAAWEGLLSAAENDDTVEGRVEKKNPGGYTVRVGSVAAFCPASHMGRMSSEEEDALVGRTLRFHILDVRDRDVVLTRKRMAEAEAEVAAAGLWAAVSVGDLREGVVTAARPFGVFVEVEGVRGLVPSRELGWGRADAPTRGTKVNVRIIEIDREARRLTFSMKDPDADPWARIGRDIHAGDTVEGEVVRLTEFGAFVRLAPGLEGLVHISRMAEGRVERASDVVKEGQKVTVHILSADGELRRLELSMTGAGDGSRGRNSGSGSSKSVVKKTSFGTFGDLFSGIKLS